MSESIKEGELGERQGFDFVWYSDHLTDLPPFGDVADPWVCLGYLSSMTKRIRLASGVSDALKIHPAKMAHIVATLDRISEGRAVLGLGAGEVMNTLPYGVSWEPVSSRVQRLREFIRVLRLLWSSTFDNPQNFNGQYYSLQEAHLALHPIQKPLPIYIGSFASSRTLEIVGELANGWFPGALNTPKSYKAQIETILQSARRSQRKTGDIDFIANVPIILGKDPSTRRKIRSKLKKFLFLNRYMFKILGAEEIYESVSRDLQFQLLTPSPSSVKLLEKRVSVLRVPDEILDKCIDEMMAVGSLDDILSKIEEFIRAGATHIYVGYFMSRRQTYELVSKEIIPYFSPGNRR